MKRLVLITTLAILIALFAGGLVIYGQERRDAGTRRPGAMMVRLLMRLMDLNNDGEISKQECRRFFADADQDKDGSVKRKEMMQLMNERRRGLEQAPALQKWVMV